MAGHSLLLTSSHFPCPSHPTPPRDVPITRRRRRRIHSRLCRSNYNENVSLVCSLKLAITSHTYCTVRLNNLTIKTNKYKNN